MSLLPTSAKDSPDHVISARKVVGLRLANMNPPVLFAYLLVDLFTTLLRRVDAVLLELSLIWGIRPASGLPIEYTKATTH